MDDDITADDMVILPEGWAVVWAIRDRLEFGEDPEDIARDYKIDVFAMAGLLLLAARKELQARDGL